jgi:hypothetical protein
MVSHLLLAMPNLTSDLHPFLSFKTAPLRNLTAKNGVLLVRWNKYFVVVTKPMEPHLACGKTRRCPFARRHTQVSRTHTLGSYVTSTHQAILYTPLSAVRMIPQLNAGKDRVTCSHGVHSPPNVCASQHQHTPTVSARAPACRCVVSLQLDLPGLDALHDLLS